MHHPLRGSRRLIAAVGALTGAFVLLAFGGVAGATSSTAHAARHKASPTITSQSWGTVDGQSVNLYTLSSGNKMRVQITNYGGVVQSIWVPDKKGRAGNVALGFNTLGDYVHDFTQTADNPWPAAGGSGDTYFGAIIGRYANRIGFDAANNHAGFTLNGTFFPTPQNNGKNTLHGGPLAWNTKVWTPAEQTGNGFAALKLSYTDPDGANGFPGQVTTTVTYTISGDNSLRIDYSATTTKSTVINLTNHTYFNLAGEGSGTVESQKLQIKADTFTPVNPSLIPTGEFASVAGTPFDFRKLKAIGKDIRRADMPRGDQLTIAHGYDHNWVLNGSGLRLAAVAQDPGSGRELDTYTTEPGVQFYSSNFLVGDLVGTRGRAYRQTDGFTLETQHYPDTPHHIGDPKWPSVVLDPGQTFNSTTIYKFKTVKKKKHHKKKHHKKNKKH